MQMKVEKKTNKQKNIRQKPDINIQNTKKSNDRVEKKQFSETLSTRTRTKQHIRSYFARVII